MIINHQRALITSLLCHIVPTQHKITVKFCFINAFYSCHYCALRIAIVAPALYDWAYIAGGRF